MPLGFLTRAMKRKIEDPEPQPEVKEKKSMVVPPHYEAPRFIVRPRKRARTYSTAYDHSGTGAQPIDLTGDDSDPGQEAGSSKVAGAMPEVVKTESELGGDGEISDGATAVGEESTQATLASATGEASQADTVLVAVADAGTQVDPTMLAPPPPPPVYTYDDKYNFKDGDIILRVASTLFRIHTSRLVHVEGLFGQLLSLPQPENSEKIDGVTVCDLCNLVTPHEFQFLLAVIYGDLELKKTVEGGSPQLHWEGTMAVLSASHKLDLPTQRRLAIAALQLLFPCDIDSYRPVRPTIRGVKAKERETFLRTFPLQAINAFRDFDLPAFGPVAYYLAAQLSIEDIVNGVPRGDDTTETICAYDITRVLEGREKLRASRRSTVFSWLDNITPDGKPKRPCDACDNVPSWGGDTCFYYLLRTSIDFNRNGFLDTKTEALEGLPEKACGVLKEHLCEHCWEEVKKWMQKGLDDNWCKLPTYFGLEGWDQLIAAQAMSDAAWEDT